MIKIQNIARPVVATLAVAMLSGCGLYKKFEMPTDTALQQEYVEAKASEGDARAFGNLQWQEVFTDPMLADLINQALANNVDLANAKLNVDIAHANLRGARMSYFPSLSLTHRRRVVGKQREAHRLELHHTPDSFVGSRYLRQNTQQQASRRVSRTAGKRL